jgi:hypothetical protein
MPGRIPTLPLFQSLRLRKPLHSLCPFVLSCPPMGKGGWGEFCWEGRGESKAWNDDVGVMMKWSAFYILFTKEFSESLRGTHITSCLCFALRSLLYSFLSVGILHLTSCMSCFGNVEQTEGMFWQAWRKNENLAASLNYLRQTFASEENERTWKLFAPNLCAWWKNRLSLKMFAPNLCAWWKNRRSLKMFAPNLCAWWKNRRSLNK